MKRILVYGMTSNIGGVEKFIVSFCGKISSNDIVFDYLISDNYCVFSDEIKKNGSKIIKLHHKHLKQPLKFKKECIEIMTKGHYDAFWLNDCSLNSFHLVKIAKKCGIKTRIIHSHNSSNMDYSFKGIIKHLIHIYNKMIVDRYATDFWACSDLAADYFYKKTLLSRVVIIKNGIDTQLFKYDERARNIIRKKYRLTNSFVIGHVGRFHFQKNHEYLINLFYHYSKIDKNSKLILIGEGEDKNKIVNLINDYKLNNNVLLLGSRDDVNMIMQGMDVFILPSLFEGLPIVGIEAQCSGLPCLFSDRITKKVMLLPSSSFLPIDNKKIDLWVKKISEIKTEKYNRINAYKAIIDNGYDINIESNKIKSFFKER